MPNNFDPDAFLAGTNQSSGFDPDAFLSGKAQPSYPEQLEPGIYGETSPPEQKVLENLGHAAGGYYLGKLGTQGAVALANGIKNIFTASPNLMSAGIKPTTIYRMAPRGVNPAEFGSNLEQSLSDEGALGKDASETFNRMNALKNKAGTNIQGALSQIASRGPITVNAQDALQPVLDGWTEHADAATTAGRRMARPFEQVYNKLSSVGAQNGGMLDLDSVRKAMEEIGPLTHAGSDEMQLAHSRLYGALADVRDGMVNKIADLSNDPQLADNLLKNNALYSKYMRLMPDVEKAAAAIPIKEGLTPFQRFGGPKILELGSAYGIGKGISDLIPGSSR